MADTREQSRRRILPFALTVLAVAGIGAAVIAASAFAETNRPETGAPETEAAETAEGLDPVAEQPKYVALGDSYVSGLGAGDYLDDDGCHRSANAYPALAATATDAEFTFAACSGARVANVIADQLANLDDGTDLVTIGVGGNDAGFATVLGACANTDTALCESAVANARSVIETELPAALDDLYAQVTALAPDADVTVVGNPRLFNGTSCAETLAITPDEQALLNEAADLLAATTAAVAADHGLDFADVRDAFTGHEICAADPWILGYTGDIDSFHANAAGQAAYAEAVIPFLDGS